MLTTIK